MGNTSLGASITSNWRSSNRRQELPSDWYSLRKKILARDSYQCQELIYDGKNWSKCLKPANQVDHIRPGSDHRDTNLRALCEDCHKRKSSSEGGKSYAERRKAISESFRRVEKHPADLA